MCLRHGLNDCRRFSLCSTLRPVREILHFPGSGSISCTAPSPRAWSITVSGNWRVTFVFELGDVFEVDLVDYH